MSHTNSLIVVQLGAPDSRIAPLPVETCSHLSHLQIQLYPRKETALPAPSLRILVSSNYLLLMLWRLVTQHHQLIVSLT